LKKPLHIYSECGFTLIEVLVAIVVFSIGLLGLASIQIVGIKLTGDSLTRSIAAVQANDMVDRMRTNVTATTLGVNSPYNNPTGTSAGNPSCLGLSGSGGSANTSCSPTQMAMHDFYEWFSNIAGAGATGWYPAVPATLPSGSGVVCVDSTPNDGTPASPACDNVVLGGKPIFAVKIWWIERKDVNNPGQTHRYVTSFSL
jgi:type IV pilus assembly protein PilV